MNILKKWFKPKPKLNLHELFIIRASNYPCDKCQNDKCHNDTKCFKLIFANRTICVTDKENADSFRPFRKSRHQKH